MRTVDVHSLLCSISELLDLSASCETLDDLCKPDIHAHGSADAEFMERAKKSIERFLEIFDGVNGFARSCEVAEKAAWALSQEGNAYQNTAFQAISAQLQHVVDAIVWDADKLHFLYVPENLYLRVDNPVSMGIDVVSKFPSARQDIVAAGNCLAVECSTAAVFHLMRVVEWGLRAFCGHFGLRTVVTKGGKRIPLSYSQWEQSLNVVQQKVDQKIQAMTRGAAKQAAQEFYYPILQDIRGIRDAWRNHVMHSRSQYDSREAEAIFDSVKRLMALMATRISEKAAR